MINKISDKDKKAWEDFLSKNEKLPNKDFKLKEKKNLKTKNIDLHGYSLNDANKTIKNFIEDESISETRRKIYQYIVINTAILILFICIQYPLRKTFIFVKNPNDYVYSYILYMVGIMIYICFDSKYFI